MGRNTAVAILVIAFRFSAGWLSCVTYQCSNLKQNACASLGDGGTVNLANSPCEAGTACKFQDLLNWYTKNDTSRANILLCNATEPINIGDGWPCANRQASKNLKNGNYPKECLSDTDCELIDGSKNPCVCTPRTRSTAGYCKPDVSSSFFQDYWNLCTLNSNTIADQYLGYFWYLKIQFSVYYYVSDLPACNQTLWELSQLTWVNHQISSAVEALAVASVMIVA